MTKDSLFDIEKYLKGRVVIVGVGNTLRGDDQFGPLLISRLQGKVEAVLFDCQEAPENYLQPVIKSGPDTIFIVDASDWGGQAGEIKVIKKDDIDAGSFSTHNSSLGLIFDFWKNEMPFVNIIIIGVQIANRGFMQALTAEVEVSLNKLTESFIEFFGSKNRLVREGGGI